MTKNNKKRRGFKSKTLLKYVQKDQTKTNRAGRNSSPYFNNFDSIELYEKREIVKPYLHEYDKNQLCDKVSIQVSRLNRVALSEFRSLVPNHLISDIYSLYYNKSINTEFSRPTKNNKIKFNILSSINNSMIKIVSNSSPVATYLYSEVICNQLYKKFHELPPEDQKKLKNAFDNSNKKDDKDDSEKSNNKGDDENSEQSIKSTSKNNSSNKSQNSVNSDKFKNEESTNSGDGDKTYEHQSKKQSDKDLDNASDKKLNDAGKEDSDPLTMEEKDINNISEKIKKSLNEKVFQKQLEERFSEVQSKIAKIEEGGIDIRSNKSLDSLLENINKLDEIEYQISKLSASKANMMYAIKKILNKTTNYFSTKTEVEKEGIFESDLIDDLEGLEFIHPAFKKTMLINIENISRKQVGTIDLYMDVSASMHSPVKFGTGFGTELISKLTFAKALALEMKKLGVIGNLYLFDTRIRENKSEVISILLIEEGGGTDIENVVRKTSNTRRNSLVLTDGEDYLNSYNDNTYFLGIGTSFNQFANGEAGKKFIENKQCILHTSEGLKTVHL